MTQPHFAVSDSTIATNNSSSSRTATVAAGNNINLHFSNPSNDSKPGVQTAMDNTYGSAEPDNNCGLITEAGVEIGVHHNNSALSAYERTAKSSHYNPKMAIGREFVLCALATYCSQRDVGSPPGCLDALGSTGLAGIQWKKHLGKKAHVTITDRNNLDLLEANCYRNNMLPKELPIDYSRIPGLSLPHQLVDEVFIQQISANVIMHLEAFDFVFIDAHGSCAPYLDAAFSNIRNNGLLCFVSSDLSALFAKTGHVAVRNYGASVIKNDYMKEAAVRVVIGAAAKAAAKCNKGIQVMFGVCIEPFVLVAVRVQRGPYYADMCSVKVRPLVHCQMCEERAFCPDSRAAVENLYDLLPCDCHSENPGKTAVQLGPMWNDNIFNARFVELMMGIAAELKLSDKLEAQLCSIFQECVCTANPQDANVPSALYLSSSSSLSSSPSSHHDDKSSKSSKHKSLSLLSSFTPTSVPTPVTGNSAGGSSGHGANPDTVLPPSTNPAMDMTATTGMPAAINASNSNSNSKTDTGADEKSNARDAVSVTVVSTSSDPHGNLKMDYKVDRDSRNCRNRSDEPPMKRIRMSDPDPSPALAMPPFFYNIHKRKFKGVFLPKLPKMVHLLQTEGYRASRTVFDSYGIRTSANQKQVYDMLLKYCKQES